MSQSFHFELVSPERLVLSKDTIMVTLPGGDGEYGVLAGHAPMITTIRAGVINIYENNDTTVSAQIFVAGGFAEVTRQRCTVLADEVIAVSDINRAQVEEQIRTLSDALKSNDNEIERQKLEEKLLVAQAKMKIGATH